MDAENELEGCDLNPQDCLENISAEAKVTSPNDLKVYDFNVDVSLSEDNMQDELLEKISLSSYSSSLSSSQSNIPGSDKVDADKSASVNENLKDEANLWNLVEQSPQLTEKKNKDIEVTSEADDLERLTHEYQHILDVSNDGNETDHVKTQPKSSMQLNENEVGDWINHKLIANSDKETSSVADEKLKCESDSNKISVLTDGTNFSDVEDALDKDVRRILAKYGRRLSSSGSESGSNVGTRDRMSPAGSDFGASNTVRSKPTGSLIVSTGKDSDYASDSDVTSLSERVSRLLTGSTAKSANNEPSVGNQQIKLPSYLLDDPAKSMSIPLTTDATSDVDITVREMQQEQTLNTDHLSLVSMNNSNVQSSIVSIDHSNEESNKTDDLLAEAIETTLPMKDDENKSVTLNTRTGIASSRSSQVSSIDYQHLERELEDLTEGLKQLKEIRLEESKTVGNSKAENESSFLPKENGSKANSSTYTSHSSKENDKDKNKIGIVHNANYIILDDKRSENTKSMFGSSSTVSKGLKSNSNFGNHLHALGSEEKPAPNVSNKQATRYSKYDNSEYGDQWGTPKKKEDARVTKNQIFQDNGKQNLYGRHTESVSETQTYEHSSAVDRDSNMSSPVINSLLTSKVIPFDIALDMVHGSRITIADDVRSKRLSSTEPKLSSNYGQNSQSNIRDIPIQHNLLDTKEPYRYDKGYYDDSSEKVPPTYQDAAYSKLSSSDQQERYDYATSILRKYGIIPDEPGWNRQTFREDSESLRLSNLYSNADRNECSPKSEVDDELEVATQYTNETSLTERVQEILERHSPTKQTYSNMPNVYATNRPLYARYTDSVMNSELNRTSDEVSGSNFSFLSPVKHQSPLQATSQLQKFMSLQIDRAAAAKFDVSVLSTKGHIVEDVVDDHSLPKFTDDMYRQNIIDSQAGNYVRPAASRILTTDRLDEYYIGETVHDDCGMSETTEGTTVESTHPGSDDAKGPCFPSYAYGSRSDGPNNALGIYGKTKESKLPDIHEQSSEEKSGNSKGSNGSEKFRRIEDKERSLRITEDWLNGSYPGRSDNNIKLNAIDSINTDVVSDQFSQSRQNTDSVIMDQTQMATISPVFQLDSPQNNKTSFTNPTKQRMTSTPAETKYGQHSTSPKQMLQSFAISKQQSPIVSTQPLDFRLAQEAEPVTVGVVQMKHNMNPNSFDSNLPSKYYFSDGSVVDRSNEKLKGMPDQCFLPSGYISRRIGKQATFNNDKQLEAIVTEDKDRLDDNIESDATFSPSAGDSKSKLLKRLMNLFMEEMPETDLPSNLHEIWLKYKSLKQRPGADGKTESVAYQLQRLSDAARNFGTAGISGQVFEKPIDERLREEINETRHTTLFPVVANSEITTNESSGNQNASDVNKDAENFVEQHMLEVDNEKENNNRHEASRDFQTNVSSPQNVTETEKSHDRTVDFKIQSNLEVDPMIMSPTANKEKIIAPKTFEEEKVKSNSYNTSGTSSTSDDSQSHSKQKQNKEIPGKKSQDVIASKPPPTGGHGLKSSGNNPDEQFIVKNLKQSQALQKELSSGEPKCDDNNSKNNSGVKTAWIVRDETLQSIPEDIMLDSMSSDVTNSSMDSEGRVVVRTTKRHLPDDPRLLKLQEKIHRQKEQYNRNCSREMQRKQHIQLLKLMMQNLKAKKSAANITSSSSSVSEMNTLSELSSSILTVSGDNQALHDFNYGDNHVSQHLKHGDNQISRSGKNADYQVTRNLKYKDNHIPDTLKYKDNPMPGSSKVNSLIPHHSNHTQFSPTAEETINDSSMCSCMIEEFQKSNGKRDRDIQSLVADDFLEQAGTSKKNKKDATVDNRALRKAKNSAHKSQKLEKIANQDKRSIILQQTGFINVKDSATQTTLEPEIKLVDCYTPHNKFMYSGDLRGNSLSTNNMSEIVRESYPTTSNPLFVQVKSHDLNCCDVPSCPRDAFVSIPTKKQSSCNCYKNNENLPPPSSRKKNTIKFQKGVSWFVPMKKSVESKEQAINRFPLQDTKQQLNEKNFLQSCLSDSAAVSEENAPNILGSDIPIEYYFTRHRSSENQTKLKSSQTSLKEVFELCRPDFITRSRERLKLIALKAEERRIQALHEAERKKLFEINRKKETDPIAHPYSEHLHLPQKRTISKQEMKEMTERRYLKLPEVTKKIQDIKKKEEGRTNRLRAQLFKEKVRSRVLGRHGAQLPIP